MQNGFRGARGVPNPPFFERMNEQVIYLANASFHLERGISSSISILSYLAFCSLFLLPFSPFLLLLPSSSSLSSSSVSLLSLCLDFRYSSHLSGWKSPSLTLNSYYYSSAVKYSFVLKGMQTRRKGQHNAEQNLSPRLCVKPLITAITAITRTSRSHSSPILRSYVTVCASWKV